MARWAVAPGVVIAAAASVAADSGVEWHAPAECPSAAQAAEEIARLRAPGPSSTAQAQVEIRRESARNLRARVSIRAQGQPREQVLRDADCTALTRAAALVVAMAAEPESPAARDKASRSPPTAAGAQPGTSPPTAAGASGANAAAARDGSAQRSAARTGTGARVANARADNAGGPDAAQGDIAARDRAPANTDPLAAGAARDQTTGASRSDSADRDGAVGAEARDRASTSADPRAAGTSRSDSTNRDTAARADAAQSGSSKLSGTEASRDSQLLAAASKRASAAATPDDGTEAQPSSTPPKEERVVLPVPLPDRRAASPGPRVTLTPQPTAAGRRDRAEPAETGDADSRARELRAFVSGAVGASAGIVPNLAPSALLSAGILMRDVHAAVRFWYVPRQHAWLAAGAGGHVALTSAAAEGGYRLHFAGLEVPLFAGLEGGVFSADADGVADHSPRSEAWLAAFAGSGVGVTWNRRLAVALRGEGVLALRRPSFALATADGAERLVFHQPSALGARVYLSLELQFL